MHHVVVRRCGSTQSCRKEVANATGCHSFYDKVLTRIYESAIIKMLAQRFMKGGCRHEEQRSDWKWICTKCTCLWPPAHKLILFLRTESVAFSRTRPVYQVGCFVCARRAACDHHAVLKRESWPWRTPVIIRTYPAPCPGWNENMCSHNVSAYCCVRNALSTLQVV